MSLKKIKSQICVGFNFSGRFLDPTIPQNSQDMEEHSFKVNYQGREIEIISGAQEQIHRSRSFIYSKDEIKNAFKDISHLLNEFSWHFDLGIELFSCLVNFGGLIDEGTKNYLPRFQNVIADNFKQTIFNEKQHLALGFFREALSSNSPYYKFQSYYKIIEIPFKTGNKKGEWIKQCLKNLKYSKNSIERMKRNGVQEIADWLFINGRNALNHAYAKRKKIIDISDYEDWDNIKWANEIVKEIAEVTMQKQLKIPTPRRS